MTTLLGILIFYLGMPQESNSIFNIYFKQDFEDDTPGIYDYNELLEDWNYPGWTDPRQEYWDSYGQILITSENNNKFLRHEIMEGEASTNDKHGMQWWSDIGDSYDEAYFSYRLRLREGFEPVLSGKFSGLKGGRDFPVDNPPGYDDGWVQMLTWNYYPDLIQYIYWQKQPGNSGDPFLVNYGLPTGIWMTVTTRVVMNTVTNDVGNPDGLCETFVDGVLYSQITNLIYRNHDDIGIEQMLITNFFGGDPTPEWAAKRDEYVDFDDFVLFTYKDGVDVPRGTEPSQKNRTLILPDLSNVTVNKDPVDRDSDTTIIKIEAYGDGLNNINAHFQLLVNNKFVGESDVTSTYDTYVFDVESPVHADDTVYIVFTNDEYIPDIGDRNLYINSITFNGYRYYPNSNNVVYVYEGLSGIEINKGTSDMYYDGELVFFTGQISVNPDLLYSLFQNSPLFTNSSPVIADQTVIISDTIKNGKIVGQVSAYDPDPDQNLNYTILSGNVSNTFSINKTTGIVSVANSVSLSKNDQFLLEIRTEDDHIINKSDTGLMIIKINHCAADLKQANVYYIDPSNTNDLAENGSEAHPFDTWSEVNWESGNTYLQKRGTIAYEKKINIGASNITIGTYGKGELPTIRSQAKDFAMRIYENKNIKINNIHLVAEEAISCIYFLGSSCDSISINNCVFESSHNGIRIIGGKTFDILYNTFINCIDAIYSFAESNKIFYNVFRENNTAVNVNSNLSKAEIFNNVFYYNTKGISASYSELVIYNNIFYLKEENDQALNYNFDKIISDNNIFYPEQEGFLTIDNVTYKSFSEYQITTGLDINSFTWDPQFVDIYNNNFGLMSTSPAIDAGRNVGILYDFFGATVPYGNAPDIGLTEIQDPGGITVIADNHNDLPGAVAPIVFPNPTEGIVSVSYNTASNDAMEITVTDLSGRLILKDQVPVEANSSSVAEIDLSCKASGIYLAIFKICGKSFVQKIIKR